MIKGKYQYLLWLLITVAMFSMSCGKESSCFKSTGKIVQEQRAVSTGVNAIIMEDNIDLVITQDSEAAMMVEGGENLLPYVNTEVSGNELKISSDNKCSFLRDYDIPITVYLSVPDLKSINYTGQGMVSCTNTLNLNEFDFETRRGTGSINMNINANKISVRQHTGPTDITISGSANNVYLYGGGNGWIYAQNLDANDVHANNAGTGDISLKASNTLLVELSSIGNINYYGDPVVTVSVHTGSGQLIKK